MLHAIYSPVNKYTLCLLVEWALILFETSRNHYFTYESCIVYKATTLGLSHNCLYVCDLEVAVQV